MGNYAENMNQTLVQDHYLIQETLLEIICFQRE